MILERLDAFNSLNAATATGPGAVAHFYGPVKTVAMQVSATGSPTGLKVSIELSLDGINFYTGATFDITAGDNVNDIKVAADIPCTHARANLLTLSGGTSAK